MTRPRAAQAARHHPGAPPGFLVARQGSATTRLVARLFSAEKLLEVPIQSLQDLPPREPGDCLWLEVIGLANTDLITAIGEKFALNALSLEDTLDPAQRVKFDDYGHYAFIVLRTLTLEQRVRARQLNLFLGEGFVITLQDAADPALEPVRQRLLPANAPLRRYGADYLAYAILDAVIDHYFPVLDDVDENLERVQEAVLAIKSADIIDLARDTRADLQTLRHAVWALRDAVSALMREEVALISADTRVHLRDCYDHVTQLQQRIEASRENAAELLEAHISIVSLRTNESMRVLTVIATVFMPLTFVTSLYGMNFNRTVSPLNMPELDWYWGYPLSLLMMVGMGLATLLYFKRIGWVGKSESVPLLRGRSDSTRR